MRLLIPLLILTASAATARAADAPATKTSTATATKTGTSTATVPAKAPAATAKPAPAKPPPLAAGEVVNVNTAAPAELERLPRVGPRLAAAIVAYREKNGPFASADDLAKVRGIKGKRLAAIKPHVATK